MNAENEHSQAFAAAIARVRARLENPEALDLLTTSLRLTSFERDLLVLAAAAEIDPPPLELTFALALRWLDAPHWSAFSPSAPLRRWRLIEMDPRDSLMHGPLRIDERALHFLMGVAAEDDRLAPLIAPLPAPGNLAPAQRAAAAHAAAALAEHRCPLVQICGGAGETRLVAASVAQSAGGQAAVMTAANVPASPAEREVAARLLEREMIFSNLLLVLDLHGADGGEIARALHLAACLDGSLLVMADEQVAVERFSVVCEVPHASGSEQCDLWRAALGERAAAFNGSLESVVRQFDFDAARIAQTAARVDSANPDALWNLCRAAARPRLETLAPRIDCRAGWDDLVLPEAQIALLHELSAQAAHRHTVHEEWGFAARGARGLGLTALFAGPSGTGKSLAAEVIAAELKLDLYRIDLSATVSKWIGETEKNLARIFDAAESGGSILFFDEADALFGRRSEVKDARDRYANIEVSYLLQRMENYRGLAILTTNQRHSLDSAFLRRLRFVVTFPLPDAAQRAAMWKRAFPAATPVDGLQPEKLARLSVTGGAIRNIALNAAFSAAAAQQPVRMSHLLAAARSEAAKSDRPVNASEIADWI